MRRTSELALVLIASVAVVATASAQEETIDYEYDARGRLVKVERSGTVNNGAATAYTYDKADNRTVKAVTGAVTVAGANFELPDLGSGYAYGPTVAGVTFTFPSGMAGNGSGFGFAAAPEGDQVAFLQSAPSGTGAISLAVSGLSTGSSYTATFYLAPRPGYGSNPISVSFEGTPLGTFTPSGSGFTQFTTSAFQAAAGSGTLTFTGTPTPGDAASALDFVRVNLSP